MPIETDNPIESETVKEDTYNKYEVNYRDLYQDEITVDSVINKTTVVRYGSYIIKIRGNYDDFTCYVTRYIKEFLSSIDTNFIYQDLVQKIDNVTTRLTKKNGITIPFYPITKEGKKKIPDTSVLTQDIFI